MSLPRRTLCWVEGPPWDRSIEPVASNNATPLRPLRELSDDELEFLRLVTDVPMNIPGALEPVAGRLRSLAREEQARGDRDRVSRYKVRAEFELMADGDAAAVAFVESTYGDVDPEPQRVLTMEIIDVVEVETPGWASKLVSQEARR